MTNREPQISDNLISQLSEFVNSRTGLYFPHEKWRDLKRNINAAAPDLGFDDPEQCIQWVLSARLTQEQVDIIVGHLTIGETFFFRDKEVFQALRDRILTPRPRFLEEGEKSIRLWSAACCTGEEPYSIAILIDQMAQIFRGWEIVIIATDINAHFLKKAKEGVYSQWSFRNTPDRLIDKYFRKTGKNRFEISPHIKEMVRFYQLNLVEKGRFSPPGSAGAMDVIFCRNVLMYLSPEMRTHVIRRLTRLLRKDGWFIVSSSETAFVGHVELYPVRFPGAVLHRKGPPRKKDRDRIRLVHSTRKVVSAAPSTVAPFSRKAETALNRGVLSRPVSRGTSVESAARKSIGSREKEKRIAPQKDLYQEACRLYEKGRYEDVVERLRAYLSQGGNGNRHLLLKSEQMALFAKALANLGKLDEAKKWCEQAIQEEKLCPDYHYLFATILQEQGDIDASIRALKQVLYLEPDFVMAYFTLGNLTKEQGKPSESRKHFLNARDLLSSMEPGEIVSYSDGITAERLKEAIEWMIEGSED